MLRTLRQAVEDLRNSLGPTEPRAGAPAGPVDLPEMPAPPEAPDARDERAALPSDVVAAPSPAARSPRRLLWLGTIVALSFVAAVVVGRWAPWEGGEPADPEVVATYEGGVVTREQLKRQLAALPESERPLYLTPEGVRALVTSAAAHEVTRRWAEEKQVDQKGTFKEAMKHATEEIQIADISEQMHQGRIQVGQAEIQAYYDENRQLFGDQPLSEVSEQVRLQLVEQKEQAFVESYLKDLKERASLVVEYGLLEVPEPTEQELVAYYQAERERFRVPEQVRIAQIRLDMSHDGGHEETQRQAESVRARLVAGEDFGQIAREVSDGPEKEQGGVVEQPVARGSRAKEFDDAVFPLQAGEPSPVFMEGDSHYVVKVLERMAERVRTYDEVRAEVADTLRAEREKRVYGERRDRTLFTIHSRRTTLGEFLQELDELPAETKDRYAGPEGKRELLDRLVERLLVVEDASEQAVEAGRKEDVEHARSDLLARVLHQDEVDEKAAASDDEVRAEYERNKADYADPPRVKVRYIRVSRGTTEDEDARARAKMQEAEGKLKPGLFGGQPADFAEIAKQYSEDPETAANGGQLDQWLGETADPLAEAFDHALHQELLPLKVGELTPVLPLGDSYYLFQVTEKQEARERSFDEAKELVRRTLEERKHEELNAGLERQLLERMRLRIYEGRVQALLAELGPAPATP